MSCRIQWLQGCFLSHFTFRLRHVIQEREFSEIGGRTEDELGGLVLEILSSDLMVGPSTDASSVIL